MKRGTKFYETMLFHYLAVYAALHVLAALYFFGFERGWGGFGYLWAFIPHFPVVLVAILVSFLGKKTKNSWVWFLALVLYLLSNTWWVYVGFLGENATVYFLFILLMIVPIFATARLAVLTKKNKVSE